MYLIFKYSNVWAEPGGKWIPDKFYRPWFDAECTNTQPHYAKLTDRHGYRNLPRKGLVSRWKAEKFERISRCSLVYARRGGRIKQSLDQIEHSDDTPQDNLEEAPSRKIQKTRVSRLHSGLREERINEQDESRLDV